MPLRELIDELLTSLDPRIVEALRARGVSQLYSHQARAFDVAAKGEHLVVVTPTASGKQAPRGVRGLPAIPTSRTTTLPDGRCAPTSPGRTSA